MSEFDPTAADIAALEAEEVNEDMEKQFPTPAPAGFDMGMGHGTVQDPAQYGRLKVVNRTARVFLGETVSRTSAEETFAKRGVKYDELFYTARFWCAAVFE